MECSVDFGPRFEESGDGADVNTYASNQKSETDIVEIACAELINYQHRPENVFSADITKHLNYSNRDLI